MNRKSASGNYKLPERSSSRCMSWRHTYNIHIDPNDPDTEFRVTGSNRPVKTHYAVERERNNCRNACTRQRREEKSEWTTCRRLASKCLGHECSCNKIDDTSSASMFSFSLFLLPSSHWMPSAQQSSPSTNGWMDVRSFIEIDVC